MKSSIPIYVFALALSFGLIINYSELRKIRDNLKETQSKILPPETDGYQRIKYMGVAKYPYDPPYPSEGMTWYNTSEQDVKLFQKGEIKIMSSGTKECFLQYQNKISKPSCISYDPSNILKYSNLDPDYDSEYSYYFAADDKEKDITIRLPANFQLKASFLPASKKWIEPTK